MSAVYDKKLRLYHIKGKYKTPEGKWKDYERYTGKNGFKRKKDAEAAEAKLKEELSNPNIFQNNTITFEEVAKQYLESQKGRKKSSTIYTDEKSIKRMSAIVNKPICKITTADIENVLKNMDSNDYSLNYISKIEATIGKIFKYAKKRKIIQENPMDEVESIIRADELKDDEIKFWTPIEFKTFISNVDDPQDYALFNFLYLTGCRKGEALALSWKDIDFEKETFRINKTCSQMVVGNPYQLTPPKTKNSIRTRKMPPTLTKIMKDWYSIQSQMYSFSDECFIFGMNVPIAMATLSRHFIKYCTYGNGWVKAEQLINLTRENDTAFRLNDHVLVNDGHIKNNADGYRTIKHYKRELIIDKILKEDSPYPIHVRMPLNKITIHGLRHSHVSLLINNGANIKAIADRIGDTVEQVLKTYAHLFHETENELVEIIEGATVNL